MQQNNIHEWIRQDEKRKKVIVSIVQPMTAKQISRKTGIDTDTCSYILCKFASRGIVTCLNPDARSSRLYWLTDFGKECVKRLQPDLTAPDFDISDIDWELYGWLCYSHRAAVLKILIQPMQPSEIKRKLRQIGSDVKISANNIRDIMRLFFQRGIVRKVFVRRKAHPRYELTKPGIKLQKLLQRSESSRVAQ